MATIENPKYAGALIVDLASVQDHLVELSPGAIERMRVEDEDIHPVKNELAVAMLINGVDAHVPRQAYQRFLERTFVLDALREKEHDLQQLVAVLKEARTKLERDREDDVRVIAEAAQSAAEQSKDPGLAAPFAATIEYNRRVTGKK